MIDFPEAYENTVSNEWPDWIKITCLSGLVYLSYYYYTSSQMDLFYYVGGTTAYLLVVLMLCVLNNVRNGRDYVLPKLLSFQFIGFAIKTLISVVPLVAFFVWAGLKISALDVFVEFPEIKTVCMVIVWTIFAGISFLAVMLFGKTGNPLSVLDIKNISMYSVDVIPHLLVVTIVIALMDAIVVGLSSYVFTLFLSLQHPAFIALCSFTLVLNVIFLGSCLAQLEYEIVPREEEEHII